MTISQASIEAALAEVARHGSVKDAAKATRRPRGYFDYRLKIASERGIDHNTKPRFRVPARLCGTQAPDFSDPPPIRPEALYSTPAEASPPSTTTLSVVVIGDTHDDPHISKERFTWLGKFAADIGPDHIVQIGDLADIESLSFHSRNETESGRYKPRFMADMESMRRAVEMLTEPLEKANATAKRHITLGNHEHRVWRFEDTAPETSGMLQRDFTSVLADHQWGWHKYGRFLEIGGVDFVHIPISKMGKPLSKPAIQRQATRDCVFGHTHAESVTTVEKNNNQRLKLIDVGSAMPDGHIGSYARDTATAPWWGAWHLTIRNGRIEGYNAVPMYRLREMYG